MTAEDIVGQTFGKLTVLARDGNRRGLALWLCSCACGKEHSTTGHNLRKGATISCGCSKVSAPREIKPGTRVGKLTVVRAEGLMARFIAYVCRCDCGLQLRVRGDRLRRRRVILCECQQKARVAA